LMSDSALVENLSEEEPNNTESRKGAAEFT
jgi:hypothetical protein